MLSCKDVTERATAIVDGDLGVWKTLQVRLHLAMCKGCSAFIDQMRTTRALIETAPEAADETGDAARIDTILATLHDTKRPRG